MRLIIVACIAALLQEDAAQEALKGYAHPWEGFGVGSYIRASHTLQQAVYNPDTKKMVWQDVTHDRTFTVEKVEKGKIWVKPAQFGLGDLPAEIYAAGPSPELSGKGARKGEDEVVVAGTNYKCALFEIQSETAIVRIWKCADFPGWAVKSVVAVDEKKHPRRETMNCISVQEKVRIGERDITCVVYETEIEAGDQRTLIKEWRSDAIPGRVARRELRIFMSGTEQAHLRQKTVVTAFEIKK